MQLAFQRKEHQRYITRIYVLLTRIKILGGDAIVATKQIEIAQG